MLASNNKVGVGYTVHPKILGKRPRLRCSRTRRTRDKIMTNLNSIDAGRAATEEKGKMRKRESLFTC